MNSALRSSEKIPVIKLEAVNKIISLVEKELDCDWPHYKDDSLKGGLCFKHLSFEFQNEFKKLNKTAEIEYSHQMNWCFFNSPETSGNMPVWLILAKLEQKKAAIEKKSAVSYELK